MSTYEDAVSNRKTLRAIYADIQDLVSAWQGYLKANNASKIQEECAEIGFHFYEGLARLVRKIQSAPTEPERQIWAIVEELKLLFDAHAVTVSVIEEKSEIPASTENYAWQSASLTTEEQKILNKLTQKECPYPHKNQSYKLSDGSFLEWRTFEEPVSSFLEIKPKNSNLQAVNAVFTAVIVPLTSEDRFKHSSWEFSAFMEMSDKGRTDFRSHEFCNYLLPLDKALRKKTTESILHSISRIKVPLSPPENKSRRMEDLFSCKNQAVANYSETPESFVKSYEKSFAPVANVFHQLKDRIDSLLAIASQENHREGATAEFTVLFSFYNAETNTISFFPLSEHEILNRPGISFGELRSFFEFKYHPEWALNGWVLSTGFCDYTKDFTDDPRWGIPLDKNPESSNAKASIIQKQIGSKVFKSDTQPFAFLLPLYAEWDEKSKVMKPLLMVSITRSQPFNRPLRRQILDHAWNAFHEIEMALHAQTELNKSFDLERKVQTIHLNHALGHSLPKFVFKPLEYYSLCTKRMLEVISFYSQSQLPSDIECRYTENNRPCISSENDALKEAFQIVHRQMFAITKGAHYLSSLVDDFKDKTLPKQHTFIRQLFQELSEIFFLTYDMYVFGRFDRYDIINKELNIRKLAIKHPVIKFGFKINGKDITPTKNDFQDLDTTIKVCGNPTTLCMHLHNVIENAINSMVFINPKITKRHSSDNLSAHNIVLSAESNEKTITITATDTGSPISSELLNKLRTMFEHVLNSPTWGGSPQGKKTVNQIRGLSTGEGSGQGLLLFAKYIRNVWDGIPPPDSMEVSQNQNTAGKSFVFRLPKI